MIRWRYIFHLLTTSLGFMMSCHSNPKSKHTTESPRIKSISRVESPRNGTEVSSGESVRFSFSSSNPAVSVDSFAVAMNDVQIPLQENQWDTRHLPIGKKSLTAFIYLSDGKVENKRINLTIYSDVAPIRYTYRVLNTFPHDAAAYTQGLVIDNDVMYESTGQKGSSTLREVDIRSGKVKRAVNISSDYFGEGIAVVGDQLFYLTWKSRQGILFDKKTFNEIKKFTYPTEGWGLTSKADTLVMSDGTNVLRFIDPESFSTLRTIEVYDQEKPVDRLNELEYVNGLILANRFQSDTIYMIDHASGKVTGILNMKGILDRSKYEKIDVLNGIAYNPSNGKYYVTGKWWPNLFEIDLISKANR